LENKANIMKNAKLNWEHTDVKWFPRNSLPNKTHPGVIAALERFFG